MKYLKNWMVFVCCWLSLAGYAQDVNFQNNQQVNLQNTFTSDKLSISELEAFEQRAVQKLRDYYS